MTNMFTQSLNIGEIPDDLNQDSIIPIYKKEAHTDPRSVSLNFISCKIHNVLLGHIIIPDK